jgi:hypothetical protein
MELADWHMWWKRSGARELRRILMEEWDPIGVRGIPEANDEYDAYLGQIGSLLRADATADEISAYLLDVEEARMGFERSAARRTRADAVAARLRTWHREAMGAANTSKWL